MTFPPVRIALSLLLVCGCSGDPAGSSDGNDAAGNGGATDDDETGFVAIFDGKSLAGWEGDTDLWKVEDGAIIGDSEGIDHNAFLATEKTYADFELRLQFRLEGGEGNSGIQFRSKRQPDSPQVEGYQADIGPKYWGCLYDEARRDEMLAPAPRELRRVLKPDDWNDYRIRAEGNRVTLVVNGMQTVDYTEPDDEIARDGIIALQVHSGPAMRISFRNIRIRDLAADPPNDAGDAR